MVSPPAEEVAQSDLTLASTHSIHHFNGGDLVSVDALPVQVELAPQEEELLPHLVRHVSVDDRVSLVVLMDNIESFPVPDTEEGALTVCDVVAEDALELIHFALEVDHDFGGRCDLLQPHLLLPAQVLVQYLEQKLCDESLNMLLVMVLGVDPLVVHLAHICLVLLVKLVHSTDHIVPLAREVLKLLIKGNLELPVLDLLVFVVL